MTKRVPRWFIVAPLVAVAVVACASACAKVWGFDDLTLAEGGPSDATAPGDQSVGSEGGGDDGAADGSVGSDDSAGDAADVPDTQTDGDAGEGGSLREGGARDAGDAGVLAAYCAGHCGGCCDAQGNCHPTTTTAFCGANGNACEACVACSTLMPACCTSKQACGCTTLGICN